MMSPRERVEAALAALGLPAQVVEFEASTRTASDAASAVGCQLGQIVKTLCFLADGRPTLVLVAGDRQVDTAALAALLGTTRKKLKMATADEVQALTGFEPGGVAPVGATSACDVVIDESLQRFSTIWAAAGSGNAVFGAVTGALAEAVKGQWAAITREP
jgi:Cys-tRNA(Pro) deacylase